MAEENRYKYIGIKQGTYEKLTKLGNLSTTFDDVIHTLIDFYLKHNR